MDGKPTNPRRGTRRAPPETQANPPRRIDRLAEIVDLCTQARTIAQGLDEKLLSYLLAMSIQETRANMRLQVAAKAGTVKAGTVKQAARRPRARRAVV